MGLAFFGLTFDSAPQTRIAVFTQIHEICFYGQGGYDWETVYDMPVWLRRFTFNKIQDHYKSLNEKSSNDGTQTNLVDPSGKINVPEFINATKQYKRPARVK